MVKKKKVLFRGAYNLYNFGDDLILITWLEFLSDVLKFSNETLEPYIAKRYESLAKLNFKSPFTLNYLELPEISECINEKFMKFRFPLRLPNIKLLIKGFKKKPILYLCALTLLSLIIATDVIVYRVCGRCIFIKKYLDSINNLDVIHYIGGGYFVDWWNTLMINEFLIVVLAKAVNPDLKIIGTGLGVGPLKSRFNRIIFKLLAKNFNYLSCRENVSSALVKDLRVGVTSKTLGDDTILLFPYLEKIKINLDRSINTKLALNLKHFFAHDYSLIKQDIENFIKSAGSQNYRIEYFYFGRTPGPQDSKLMQSLDKECRKYLTIHDSYEEGWVDFLKNLSDSAVGLGFAFHFCFLLTLMGIPVISVYSGEYYRQKIESGIKLLDADSVVLSMAELASKGVTEVMSIEKDLKQGNFKDKIAAMYKQSASEYARVYKDVLSGS